MNEVKFIDKSPEFLAALERAKRRALWAIGATAEGHAKIATPVDTGRLRNSIGHKEVGNSTYIGSNVEYAPYIELGTVKMSAYHMLRRAASEHGSEYKRLAEQAMKKA